MSLSPKRQIRLAAVTAAAMSTVYTKPFNTPAEAKGQRKLHTLKTGKARL